MPADEVGGLARLLETDTGLAWLHTIMLDADAKITLAENAAESTGIGG
jgi:hypothetical protein